jgi:integrase/recombinase XerD
MKLFELNTGYKILLLQYVEWLSIKNYQPMTIRSYESSLKEFFIYLENHGITTIKRVQQLHYTQFKNYLQTRINFNYDCGGLRNQTINSIISGVNCFSVQFNEVNESYRLDLFETHLPMETAEKVILLHDEVMQLYQASFEQYKIGSIEMGQRDRVMIAIFYGCGLRLNEGRMLDVGDIDFINNRVLVRHGKLSKQRYVPIPKKHLEDIRDYIQHGRNWFQEHHYNKACKRVSIKKQVTSDDEQALFLNQEGKRMKTFQQRLNFLKSMTSIEKHITTHSLRHTLATHLLYAGWQLEQIGKILGHASLDSTMIYTHLVKELEYEKEI